MKHANLLLYAVAVTALFVAGCATVNSSSAADRLRVVAGIEDQDELFDAIGETKYSDVKNAAARRIVREDLSLALLRERGIDADVRVGLVKNVSNPEELKRIALADDLSEEMRLAAVKRTRGESFLADIVIGAKDTTVRSKAMERVRDESQCKRILAAGSRRVPKSLRTTALDRIADEAYLADFVKDKENESALRRSAVARIEREEMLLSLLDERPRLEDWAREHAAARIANQPALVSILRDKKDSSRIRSIALRRVKDESERRAVVEDRNDNDSLRREALETLEDEESFLRLLQVEPPLEDWVREAAIPKVNDQETLLSLFRDKDSSVSLRALASERIEDPSNLVSVVADRFDDEDLRRQVLPRIEDEKLCLVILNTEPLPESWALDHAVRHVSDDGKLADVLLASAYPEKVRRVAGERIRDKTKFHQVFLVATDSFAEQYSMERADAAFLATPEAQKRLLSVFRNAKTDEERAEAMWRLSPETDLVRAKDQRLIASVLLDKDNEENRRFARQTLFDEAAICDVVLRGDESLGNWALELGLPSEKALAVALGAKCVSVQCRALLFLDEESQFAKVAEKGPSSAVRAAAIMNLTDKSADLLERLASGPDSPVTEAAIRQIREKVGRRTAASFEKKSEARRKAESERIAAEKARQKKADKAADEKLAADVFAITGARQIHGFRYYLEMRAKHPKIGSKNFRFTGVVKKTKSRAALLEIPIDGETFSVSVSFAEELHEKLPIGKVVTVGGDFKEGTRDGVFIVGGVVVCDGVP